MRNFFCFLFLSALLSLNCNEAGQQKIRIAAAANLQFAIKPLSEAFTVETGYACEVIIASSGKLTAQIVQGAPFDIFLSADMKYPQKLSTEGLLQGPPEVYAYGHMILWSMKKELLRSPDSLNLEQINYFAIANPKTAPYGRAAVEVLEYYKLLKKLEPKLVYGENIAQANQFITTQAADLGFTAKSTIKALHLANRGFWLEVDPKSYTPISQGVALLKSSENPASRQFYDFLFSAKGKEILNTFGYTTSIEK